MALKPDRNIIDESIEYFMFETATRGGVVVATSGTGGWPVGPAMDSADRRVEYAATPSGGRDPVGLLLQDVVNIDQSRQITNPYKRESQVGDKVHLLKKGWVVTNSIAAGEASGIAVPATAYVGLNGNLYSDSDWAASGFPVVGRFLTNVDSEGYAVVEIEL